MLFKLISDITQERSSAKRKQLFQTIQQQDKPNHPPWERPLQLILNMPVRWSSTYLMLDHAEKLKDVSGFACCIIFVNLFFTQDVDSFVYKIVGAEKDQEKHSKLQDLQLMDKEWTCVSMLLGLLAKAEYAQQSFSSDCSLATHLALPALKSLHKAWHTWTTKVEYAGFQPALEAGINKIISYYEKTMDSDAYIMAMCMLL